MNLAVRANNTTSRSMICQVLPNRFVEIDATLGIMKGMNAKDWWKRAAELLREEKRINDMTHEDLAEKLKVSRAAIGHYLSGRREPSIETIIKLCEIFNVSADYLLMGRQTDYDIDDIDRKVLKMLDDLAPWQVEDVMRKLDEFVVQNESVRKTRPKSETRRSRYVGGVLLRRESPRVGKPTLHLDGTAVGKVPKKPSPKIDKGDNEGSDNE